MNKDMLQKAIGEMSEAEKMDAILMAPSRRLPKTVDKLRKVAAMWQELRKREGSTGPASADVVMYAEQAYEAMLKAEEVLDEYLDRHSLEDE